MQKSYYVIKVTNTLGSVAYITGSTTPTEAAFPEVVMDPKDNRVLKFDSDSVYSDNEFNFKGSRLEKWLGWTFERTKESQKITSITVEKIEIEEDEVEEMEAVELIKHDFEEAYRELSQSYTLDEMVYSSEHVKSYYNERSEAVKAFEGSWKFEADNEEQLQLLKNTLGRELRHRYYTEEAIDFKEYKALNDFIESITPPEFQENKKDGMKLGKLLKRKGFSTEAVDYYSALDRKKEELYITITSAPQAIAGMSNHGKGWTSCQMTTDGGGSYNTHLLGSLADDKLLLMVITKEPLTEWDAEMDDVILARSCAHVFSYDGVNVLVPVGVYSSAYHVSMNTGIKHVQSLGMKVLPTQNGCGSSVRLTAEAKQADVTRYAYIYDEISEEVDVTCECPLCRGYGTYTAYVSDETEVNIDCPLCQGSGEYETTVWIEETIEDEVEVEASIGSYEENGLSYGSYYKYMYAKKDDLEAVLEL